MALMKSGKLLITDLGFDNAVYNPEVGGTPLDVGYPTEGTFLIDLFCSGHSQLAEGRIFFIGGTGGDYDESKDHAVFFNPDNPSNPWSLGDYMPPTGNETVCPPGGSCYLAPLGRRWYPSAMTRGDGTVLVLSGGYSDAPSEADVPEIFNPSAAPGLQWTELEDAELLWPWYPQIFLLPDGTAYVSGSHYFRAAAESPDHQQTLRGRLDMQIESWSDLVTDDDPDPLDPDIKGGTAVMYRHNAIMIAGGSTGSDQGSDCNGDPLTKRVQKITLTTSTLVPTDLADMNYKRRHFYLIALPTGDVLAVGGDGGNASGNGDCTQPVLAAEIYDVESNTWSVMASMNQARMYHSTALLLPDGRVVAAGGQCLDATCTGSNPLNTPQESAEFYSPPYIFGPTRPVIGGAASAEMYYGQPYTLPTTDASTITKVSLIRLGTCTHSTNFDQRYMELNFVYRQNPERLMVSAPPHGNAAPPGYYMLFIVRGESPSIAKIVKVATCVSCS